jgi:hypothetical protein
MQRANETVSATAAATGRDRLLIAARKGERMEDAPYQLAALVSAAEALEAAGIAYAFVGGIAVGIHSEVLRATQDVDVAVPTEAPRDAVAAALVGAGFELAGEYPHSLTLRHPERRARAGRRRSRVRRHDSTGRDGRGGRRDDPGGLKDDEGAICG